MPGTVEAAKMLSSPLQRASRHGGFSLEEVVENIVGERLAKAGPEAP